MTKHITRMEIEDADHYTPEQRCDAPRAGP